MQFDYEIPIEEFLAAQVLYYKTSSKGRIVKRASSWVLLGLFFVLIAVFKWAADWPPFFVLLTGVWFIYGGIALLFPRRHFRRYYAPSGLAGKKYHAELDENGFAVSGDDCSWRVRWAEIAVKGEDKQVFSFFAKGTIFIFGKRYLTEEQQKVIRQFAALQ